MEYVRQDFKAGDVLSAEQLNHIEEGLAKLVDAVNSLSGSGKGALTMRSTGSTNANNNKFITEVSDNA